MTQEQSALLQVLKTVFSPNMPLPDADSCDWEAVAKEAKQQAVSLIFYDAVAPLLPQMPDAARQKIEKTGMRVVLSNLNVGNAQVRLTTLLREQNIPHLIIKGEASAHYYPKPQLRTLGDIDFLVSPDHYAQLYPLFQQLGYEVDNELEIHHATFRAPGAVLEMHRSLSGQPAGDLGELLQPHLQGMPLRTQIHNIGNGDFQAPTNADHGLILLLHTQHHLRSSGLGLRHLMDWCCYVNQTKDDAFWQEEFLPLLKKIGLYRFAAALTGVCALAFGTTCPTWAVAEEPLCRELLEDILSGGNFGRKDATRVTSGLMVSQVFSDGRKRSKLYNLWKTFHTSVAAHYPICQKCGVFYLVFYPVRGVRYLWRMLTGKRESLIKAIPQANQRRDLYGQLQIFEVEENG